jgi:UDP-N-acetylmuramoyl-L-alanyl-D-glutamate--2,6-diaminopimelate ligase
MKYIDLKDQNLNLSDLLKQNEVVHPEIWPGPQKLSRIALHSEDVQKGDLFLSVPPVADEAQAQTYLKEAMDRQAAIIIKQDNIPLHTVPNGVIIVDVKNVRHIRSLIAQRLFHEQPSKVVAVTGTNGKTSVVNFCRQLWELLGYKAASLGSLGYESLVPLGTIPATSLNTPDPFTLHQLLTLAAKSGVTHLAFEASSHGIDQHRIDSVNFSAGGFTNLSHDHLDYHNTMDAYFKVKARLFSELLSSGETAVLNADTNYFQPLLKICEDRGIKTLSYGKRAQEGISLTGLTIEGTTQVAHLSVERHQYDIRLNFIGKFQVLNALCALGLVVGSGETFQKVLPLLEELKPVRGRLELMGTTKAGGAVYIDYAHTPDALEEALLSLRPYVPGILTVTFGCGGDRDALKRPIMGRIAGQFSDAQIVTDDNPRNEDPRLIRHEILRQCTNAQEIPNRYEAIVRSIQRLGKGDGALIAGKGHEQFQLVKNQKIPFDDRQIVRDILTQTGGVLAA